MKFDSTEIQALGLPAPANGLQEEIDAALRRVLAGTLMMAGSRAAGDERQALEVAEQVGELARMLAPYSIHATQALASLSEAAGALKRAAGPAREQAGAVLYCRLASFIGQASEVRTGADSRPAPLAQAQLVELHGRLLTWLARQEMLLAIRWMTAAAPQPPARPAPVGVERVGQAPLNVRFFRRNGSVFIDGVYLIKGVAGTVLWKLLGEYVRHGRTSFSNRELRLDPELQPSDANDNLESRLILLRRRLDSSGVPLALEKTGRGCFRLLVHRELDLQEGPGKA